MTKLKLGSDLNAVLTLMEQCATSEDDREKNLIATILNQVPFLSERKSIYREAFARNHKALQGFLMGKMTFDEMTETIPAICKTAHETLRFLNILEENKDQFLRNRVQNILTEVKKVLPQVGLRVEIWDIVGSIRRLEGKDFARGCMKEILENPKNEKDTNSIDQEWVEKFYKESKSCGMELLETKNHLELWRAFVNNNSSHPSVYSTQKYSLTEFIEKINKDILHKTQLSQQKETEKSVLIEPLDVSAVIKKFINRAESSSGCAKMVDGWIQMTPEQRAMATIKEAKELQIASKSGNANRSDHYLFLTKAKISAAFAACPEAARLEIQEQFYHPSTKKAEAPQK